MNDYVFEKLYPWMTHKNSMCYLSTKSRHKQLGDHLFSWGSKTVTDYSAAKGQRSREANCLSVSLTPSEAGCSDVADFSLQFGTASNLHIFNTKLLWFICGKRVKSLSRVQLFATPRTIRSMEFCRPETRVGSRPLLQGIYPNQGLNPGLLQWRPGVFYQLSHPRMWYAEVNLPTVVGSFLVRKELLGWNSW